ncbi:uncharacterized protein LOC143232645 [Tachypleus tridentatus]|uniref:uncharacterized protein LOC143232645 n=1 Tax=Tachypleus tridentatus TaxID=6853 RepID=UPI003FD3C052
MLKLKLPKKLEFSDFAVHKKSLRKRIWNGLKNVFCCHHDYEPFKEETIRGITDPLDETESSCHDSHNNTEQGEINSLPLADCTCGRVIGIQSDENRVVKVVKPRNKPFRFFVTQGRLKNCKGSEVFMTRMSDYETLISFREILDPGDKILEINNVRVSEENIGEIKNITVKTKNIRFTTMCLSN